MQSHLLGKKSPKRKRGFSKDVPVARADATAVAGTFAMSLTATALLVPLHLFSRHGARGVTRVLRIGGRT